MGDDHVDRLGVDALQGVKLTSTNRPCGLTIKYLRRESRVLTHAKTEDKGQRAEEEGLIPTTASYDLRSPYTDSLDDRKAVTGFLGGLSGGVTPVPIPNTAVKPSSPDGTSR